MTNLLDAIQKDVNGDFVGAADCYERVIQQDSSSLVAYLNLSVLYWQCTDFGFNAGHHLDIDFIHKAGERYPTVLHEASEHFPSHSEVKFWRLYCDYITLGEPPFDEECEQLVSDKNDSLVPYFYLYSAYQGGKYEQEVDQLLEQSLKCLTVKNEYIISVIRSGKSHFKQRMGKLV